MYLQVYNPLQQVNTNLQGGSVQLQGGYNPQAVAGPSLAELKAPAPAPIAPQAPKTPSSAPVAIRGPQVPAQPAINDLSGRFANVGGTIYDKATGQGFSDPASFFQASGVNSFNNLKFDTAWTPQPAQPAQPAAPADPYLQLAGEAGAAGMSATDLAKLIGLTPEEKSQIYGKYGTDALATEVFTAPSKSTQQIYSDAYASAGLADIKSKFQTLQDTINKRYQDLTAATGQINENPWLSEASRVGKVRRLTEAAQGDIANLEKQAQQYADLYNEALTQVNQVVQNTTADISQNQQLKAQQLQYLIAKAEQEITSAQESKLARYFPEYLAGKSSYTDTSKTPTSYQEYLLAKREGFQGTYNDYQTMDANRKRSVTVLTGGLPSAVATRVDKITGQFDNEPVVKNYNVISEAKGFVDSLNTGSRATAADDQGLLYAFAKAMDPNSVVREGEYATVQKYAQSWADTFGFNAKRVFSNSPFLTDQARANMKETITKKYQASETNYQNVYKEYGRRVDQATGQNNGTEYLTNYGQAFTQNQPTGSSGSAQDAINKWVP